VLTAEHKKHFENNKKQLEQIINVNGWFVVTVLDICTQYNSMVKNISKLELTSDASLIILESKYDIELEKVPEKLYHASLKKYRHKILSKGLNPKNKNKLTYHPKRIYLTKTIESAKHIANELTNDEHIDIYEVSNKYSNRRYFEDVNYDGLYTMENIPTREIELIKSYIK